ncbi:MAG: hypothetical protein JO154_25655 [Chitinophaga sp.]|uniref:lipase family protein n=1 Tax=Chitinophaga sp. TaxID=1869181 RepID=UPI0025C1C583|nr:hypothetical protein [Chitinophaga sp.]MBV8256007.1 hypothetical protein [Chitinophaga sp.]
MERFQYSPSHAKLCMTLSAMAYAGPMSAIEWLLADPGLPTNEEWELQWYGAAGENALFCAWNKNSGAYAISVRGSVWKEFSNIFEDVDVVNVSPWHNGYIAKGIWDGLQNLVSILNASGHSIIPYLRETCFQHKEVPTIFITGHSLGGALANALSLYIQEQLGRPVNLIVYTFGAPGIGDATFTAYYDQIFNTMLCQAFRVYNDKDVIPYAYGDLQEIIPENLPVATKGMLNFFWDNSIRVFMKILLEMDRKYVQIGPYTHVLSNAAMRVRPYDILPTPPVNRGAELKSWFTYEHGVNTYLYLLETPLLPALPYPVPISETEEA